MRVSGFVRLQFWGGPEGPGNGWQHVLVVMLFHGLDELQACFTFLI